MSEEFYRKCSEFFGKYYIIWNVFDRIALACQGAIISLYAAAIVWAVLSKVYVAEEPDWSVPLQLVLVPAVGFVVVTIARMIKNSPRPYEVYDFAPLIIKKRGGKSFPSRHAFSATVIVVTCISVGIVYARGFALVILVLAAHRIIAGVHFVKDILGGIAFGLICALIGYVVFMFI